MEYCTLETADEIVKEKFTRALTLTCFWGKIEIPTVIWRPMGVRRAGYATYSTNTITLNQNYLHSKSYMDFLEDTPLHELAHLLAYKLYKETGHGDAWKMVSHKLGLKGNRCHNFATPEDIHIITRTQEKHAVCCDCRTIMLSTCRYKRLLAGTQYRCKLCGGKLRAI